MERPRLEAWLASVSVRRRRVLQRLERPADLPAARQVPLQGPLDLVSRDQLTVGLPEDDARVACELRRQAVGGHVDDALQGAEELWRRHSGATGAAFLVGAIRMLDATTAADAIAPLRQAMAIPGARGLLGDALWAVGDLEGAQPFLVIVD